MKKKRQSGRRQQKIEELTELEVEELMIKDKQWQHYPWICSDCSQVIINCARFLLPVICFFNPLSFNDYTFIKLA